MNRKQLIAAYQSGEISFVAFYHECCNLEM